VSIEIRQLRYAVLTADTQSFLRAAAAPNVKQSTLSRRVMQLEDRLGVKLFERTTRGAEPTVNGKVFIEQARRAHQRAHNGRTFRDYHTSLRTDGRAFVQLGGFRFGR
jgi:DNA-binding transcriptional LysR family regulator